MFKNLFILSIFALLTIGSAAASCYETNCRYENRCVSPNSDGSCSAWEGGQVCDTVCHDENPQCVERCTETNCRQETRCTLIGSDGSCGGGYVTETYCDQTCYNDCN